MKYTPLLLAASFLFAGCFDELNYRGTVSHKTSLIKYQSCAALESDLKAMLIAEVDANFERSGWFDVAQGAEDGSPSAGGREEGTDYSGTNNQESGVDEADFVKTDGYFIYVLNGNRLHIYGVAAFGDLDPESVTQIEGQPREMLINRDAERAVVFSMVYPDSLPEDHPLRRLAGRQADSGWMWRAPQISKITVLDISDRAAPTLVRELFVEGWYQTARMIDQTVRLGAYSRINVPGMWDWWWYWGEDADEEAAKRRAKAKIRAATLADLIPFIYERNPAGEFTTHSLSNKSCRSFARPTNSHARGITSLLSLDLLGDTLAYDADHVVSNWATLYSSKDFLYLAEPANDWWWFWWNDEAPEQLNVHAFDVSNPGESVYVGSGRVEGLLHNQFSLDEQDGYLRVATTSNFWNRWWLENPPESDNHIWVLENREGVLEPVGHLGGIAGGERIFAARMIGDRGYLVTFRQVDPLFTLDLSDPTDPRLVGELEIPGFSTYIHPIADDKLLTIGVGGDENGANWRAQVSMFDVSDFSQPRQMDVEELSSEGEWGGSEALYEHKAFQYWAPKKLLAVPASTYSWTSDSYYYRSRLDLITVDTTGGLSHYGSIDHSEFFNSDPTRWWDYRDVRRSIFMGNFIYAISDRGITVHNVDTMMPITQQTLPGRSPDNYWWWW